jgi:predicted nucleotidyltransferase
MDVLTLLRQHEPELRKRFGVAKIGIFGSFIRERGTAGERCGRPRHVP